MSIDLVPVGRMPGMPKRGKMPTMFLPNPTKDAKLANKKVPLEFTLCTHVNRGKVYPYNSKKRGQVHEIHD